METKVPEADVKKTEVVDQDYPITHVPLTARRSFFSIAAVLLGITFFAPTMSTGAQIAAAFRFSDLMLIVLFGNLILGVYVALNCAIGAKTGLTSVMLSCCSAVRRSAGTPMSALTPASCLPLPLTCRVPPSGLRFFGLLFSA